MKSIFASILVTALSSNSLLAQAVEPPAAPVTEHKVEVNDAPATDTPAVKPETTADTDAQDTSDAKKEIPKALVVIEKFIPVGGLAQIKEQADIDLFTRGKEVGHVQDNPTQPYRRLVQRTIMITEPISKAGAVLTFDDQLVADSPRAGSALDIVKTLAPLNTRAIFFANVNGLSSKDLYLILKKKVSSDEKKKQCRALLDSKKKHFVDTIRSLIKVQGPADKDGNREYICEVYNHTAFHQDMSKLKVGTEKFDLCMLGIDFIEECLEDAYNAERPEWERARYFRFPFLHTPKDKATKAALNKKFTEHGLISLGETQDSKDVDNYSSTRAYNSLAAAKKNRRYNPRFGVYGRAEKPVALFHTKTWRKIKSGIIKAIKE